MIHFHFSNFQASLYWLFAGWLIGYASFRFISERRLKLLSIITAAFLLGAFTGGYYSWFAGVKAQAGQFATYADELRAQCEKWKP